MPEMGEPLGRVVVAEQQAVLGPRSEHPVRLVHSLGDQVVDQHADVRLVPAQDERGLIARVESRVDARHQPLGRSLLVARGTVELPGAEEPAHGLGLQRESELLRGKIVVFHGVARPDQAGALETRRRSDDHLLDEHGQTGGQPLKVHLLGGDALRLDEDRVLLLLREVDELPVDGWTVSRALAADRSALERAQVEVFGHHLVSSRRRVRQVAGHLPTRCGGLPVREGQGHGIALLENHAVWIDGVSVDARRCRRLEAVPVPDPTPSRLSESR